jgi:glycosyltransferase involved in cell wall biosynthesis
LKISHFTSSERGGSGVLTLRLHRSLLKLGHNSAAYLRDVDEKMDEFIFRKQFTTNPGFLFLERLGYSLENRIRKPVAPSYFSRLRLAHSTPSPREDMEIVHLHWVGRWLDLPSFVNSLPSATPIVWTVHDMSPLAGGCFTDFGCGEFEKGCRVCPLLKFPINHIWAKQELQSRLRALASRPVAFIANSHSTFRLVEKAPLAKGKMQRVIPPGFDFSEMKHTSKRVARRALGIPEEAFVLGFGAASLTDENKGINRFYEVAQRVAQEIPNTQVLIFGDGNPETKIPTHHLGTLKNPAQLAQAYSAMDAHVVTSQMETFGQVSVEAQACGTPVFAFAVGGLPETLVDWKTGVLVPFGECEQMAEQIVAAHRAGRLEPMGQAGAEWVRGQFDSLVVAKKYLEVYEELLAGTAKRRQEALPSADSRGLIAD